MAWEIEFEPKFDNPNPYQVPNVIDLNRVGRNVIPNDTSYQIYDDTQNHFVDAIVDCPTFRDVGQSTVTDEISELTTESHTTNDQIQIDLTKSRPRHKDTSNTPSASKAEYLQDGKKTRGENYNLRPKQNPHFSDIYRY